MNKDLVSARSFRGILIMLGGSLLLLYTLGLMQRGLSLLLVLAAIGAIIYGFYLSGLYDFVRAQFQRTQTPRSE